MTGKRTKPYGVSKAAILLLAPIFMSISADASAQSYSFATLSTLGGTGSYAAGINNAGQVVGGSLLAGDVVSHATVWNGGVATDLTPTLQGSSGASGINNLGQIVGGYSVSGSGSQSVSFVTSLNGTTFSALGSLGGTSLGAGLLTIDQN